MRKCCRVLIKLPSLQHPLWGLQLLPVVLPPSPQGTLIGHVILWPAEKRFRLDLHTLSCEISDSQISHNPAALRAKKVSPLQKPAMFRMTILFLKRFIDHVTFCWLLVLLPTERHSQTSHFYFQSNICLWKHHTAASCVSHKLRTIWLLKCSMPLCISHPCVSFKHIPLSSVSLPLCALSPPL